MPKLAIIGFCNLNIMQYLYKYTNILDHEGIPYDVIYWNRLGIKEAPVFLGRKICYDIPVDSYQPFYRKITSFIQYSHFLYHIIRKNKYDKLIILTTQTAVPLFPLLYGKYRGRYIYDYRDITVEKKSPLLAKMARRLIRCSSVTMMSSMGFLPEIGIEKNDKICMAHNTQLAQEETEYKCRLSDRRPLRIVYWGIVRQPDFNRKVCDIFGNDPRFRLTYHGTGFYKELESYCKEKRYENIRFTGGYTQEEIPGFAENTDILNCLYSPDQVMRPAMPVKAYDAIRYRIPVLVSGGTQAAEFYKDSCGACPVELTASPEKIRDDIEKWYEELQTAQTERDFSALEAQIYQDDLAFEERLKEFFK